MTKFEKIIWLFPLIGGFLILFSLFFPAAIEVEDSSKEIWIFGMVDRDTMTFFEDIYLLTGSFICSFLIVLFAISMIITSIKYRLHKNYMEKVHVAWCLQGFIVIISVLTWMILLHLLIMRANLSLIKEGDEFKAILEFSRFWEYNMPGIGIIGVIMGGFLSIIGAILKKRLIKKNPTN